MKGLHRVSFWLLTLLLISAIAKCQEEEEQGGAVGESDAGHGSGSSDFGGSEGGSESVDEISGGTQSTDYFDESSEAYGAGGHDSHGGGH